MPTTRTPATETVGAMAGAALGGAADATAATVLIATAAAKAALIALGAAAWTSTWMPHLVQDIVSWRPFLEQARQGLIPYVDFSKEYPVGGGMLYWLLARIVDPADTRRTVL